jgi:ElaB/YqjD/DUF883 family membrane-anchored ribosome-binding protein
MMNMATRLDRLVKLDTLTEARDKVLAANQQLATIDKQIRTFVREQPVAALLAAAFVGHLVGRLFARR